MKNLLLLFNYKKLNNIFFIIIVLIFVIEIIIIFIIFLKKRKKNYKNYYAVLYNFLAKRNLYINNFNITIVVGNYQSKKLFYSNFLIEQTFIKEECKNEDLHYTISSTVFIIYAKTILIIPMEQNNTRNDVSIYIYIINILMKLKQSNCCFNNLIILMENEVDSKECELMANIISKISYFVKINIPIYFIYRVLDKISGMDILVKNISHKYLSQMLGYSRENYTHEIITSSEILNQLEYIIFNIQSLIYKIFISNNFYQENIEMMNIYNYLSKNNLYIAETTNKIMKLIYTEYMPIVRSILITGLFKIGMTIKYIFISDFFTKKLFIEQNVINIGLEDQVAYRKKGVEASIFITLITIIFYTVFSLISYNSYFSKLEENHEFLNSFYSVFNTHNDICHADIIASGNSSFSAINNINLLIEKRSKTNIIHILENIFIDYTNYLQMLNLRFSNTIINIMRKLIVKDIEKIINIQRIDHTIQNIPLIINKTKEDYLYLISKINQFNQLETNKNTLLALSNLYGVLTNLSQPKIKTKHNFGKWYLPDFNVLNVNKFNTEDFAKEIIIAAIRSIDQKNYMSSLIKLKDSLDNLFLNCSLEKKVKNITDFIFFYEQIDFPSVLRNIKYLDVYLLINEIRKLNYITEETYYKMNEKIDKIGLQNQYFVLNLYNNVIEKIYFIENNMLATNYKVVSLYKKYIYLIEQNIYKKYLYNINNNSASFDINLSEDMVIIISKLEKINLLMEEYLLQIKTLNKSNFLDELFLDLMIQLLEKELFFELKTSTTILDLKENSKISAIKFFSGIINKEQNYFNDFINLVYQSNSEKIQFSVQKIFSRYIDIIYDYLNEVSAFKENIIGDFFSSNIIQDVYSCTTLEELDEKLEHAVYQMKDLADIINNLIDLLYKYKNKLISESSMGKLYYVYNTVKHIKQYYSDKENSKIGVFKKEIKKMFNNSGKELYNINKKLSLEKDYYTSAYIKLVNMLNQNKKMVSNLTVVRMLTNLKSLIKEYKDFYPITNNTVYPCLKIEIMEQIVKESIILKDYCKTVLLTNKSTFYNDILIILDEINLIKQTMDSNLLLTCEILSKDLIYDTVSTNIKIVDRKGKIQKENVNKSNLLFNITANFNSGFSIDIGPFHQTNIAYKQGYDTYYIANNNISIHFDEPFILHLARNHYSHSKDNKTFLKARVVFPIIQSKINLEYGVREEYEHIREFEMKIYMGHHILRFVHMFYNLVNKIQEYNFDGI